MTNYNRFSRQFLCGAIAMSIVFIAACVRAEDVEQVINVLKVTGNARYSTDAMKTWHKLNKGEILKQGTLIQTAEDGQVDVQLGERAFNPATPLDTDTGRSMSFRQDKNGPKANVVHLFPSTVMVVDKLLLQRTGADEVSETQLDLRAGSIAGNVKKLSGGSRYEVKIPNGVAGIRGTAYLIRGNGEVLVLTGSVVVTYVDQNGNLQTQVVTAGYAYKPSLTGPGTLTPLTSAQLDGLSHIPNPLTGPSNRPIHGPPGIIEHVSPN
jgi:hypothetical protein